MNSNENLTIYTIKNDLEAYLIVFSQSITVDDILEELAKQNITYGIDSVEVRKALLPENVGIPMKIAQGTLPINGKDGGAEYFFTIPKVFVEQKRGLIDFETLSIVQTHKRGEPLAIETLPTLGKDGISVKNKKIKSISGVESKLKRGHNSIYDSTNTMIMADIDGHATLLDGAVSILPILEINKDIAKNSNLEFSGNVVINGNVSPNSKLKVLGDLHIRGIIESADIVLGGNLITSGIANKTKIQAGGDVITKYISNSQVNASGSVLIIDNLMHSTIISDGDVQAITGHGTIVGGIIKATKGIMAKKIGSERTVPTYLELKENQLINNKISSLEIEYGEIAKKMAIAQEQVIERSRQIHVNDSELKAIRYLTFGGDLRLLTKKAFALEQEISELKEDAKQNAPILQVLDTIYPEVTVKIGTVEMILRKKQHKKNYMLHGKQIVEI